MGRSINNFTAWSSQANIQESLGLCAEERLFVAVLSQAVHDAFSVHVPGLERRQAQAWLMSNSRDFKDICEYAGRDSKYVLKKIKIRIIKEGGWDVDKKFKTSAKHRKQMKNRRETYKGPTGNAYYAAKREHITTT